MENLFKNMAEEAKKDKSMFFAIRDMTIRMRKSQVTTALDKMREELFPLKQEEKEAKKLALLFRMVNVEVAESTAWLVLEVIKKYQKKGSSFSAKDAASLLSEQKEIFGI